MVSKGIRLHAGSIATKKEVNNMNSIRRILVGGAVAGSLLTGGVIGYVHGIETAYGGCQIGEKVGIRAASARWKTRQIRNRLTGSCGSARADRSQADSAPR